MHLSELSEGAARKSEGHVGFWFLSRNPDRPYGVIEVVEHEGEFFYTDVCNYMRSDVPYRTDLSFLAASISSASNYLRSHGYEPVEQPYNA